MLPCFMSLFLLFYLLLFFFFFVFFFEFCCDPCHAVPLVLLVLRPPLFLCPALPPPKLVHLWAYVYLQVACTSEVASHVTSQLSQRRPQTHLNFQRAKTRGLQGKG